MTGMDNDSDPSPEATVSNEMRFGVWIGCLGSLACCVLAVDNTHRCIFNFSVE